MPSSPGERPAGERPPGERQPPGPGGHGGDRAAGEERVERCGTVVLSRGVKDDGRLLILYRHAEEGSS
jgi:hypothetical protein